MMLPPVSSLALKEWAVAVDALAGGKQILIIRKGGIHRDDKEFRMVHSEFLLYPTFEHQRAVLLQEQYRGDLDRTLEDNDVPGLVTMSILVQRHRQIRDTRRGGAGRAVPTSHLERRLRPEAAPLEA